MIIDPASDHIFKEKVRSKQSLCFNGVSDVKVFNL